MKHSGKEKERGKNRNMNIERPEKTFGISRLALQFSGTNLEVFHLFKSSWCFSGVL